MSKPMSEQMQKLAARYEKATGKKFNAKTNAQKIRSMTDEELAELFEELCYDSMAHRAKYWLHWLQRPAEEEPKRTLSSLSGGDWFALFKLISDIARNALAVMGTAKSVTTGTTYSAETGNGRIGEGGSDHEQ